MLSFMRHRAAQLWELRCVLVGDGSKPNRTVPCWGWEGHFRVVYLKASSWVYQATGVLTHFHFRKWALWHFVTSIWGLLEDAFLRCVTEQGQVSSGAGEICWVGSPLGWFSLLWISQSFWAPFLCVCLDESAGVTVVRFSGISWDTWVKAAEQCRRLIPVENRKQAQPVISVTFRGETQPMSPWVKDSKLQHSLCTKCSILKWQIWSLRDFSCYTTLLVLSQKMSKASGFETTGPAGTYSYNSKLQSLSSDVWFHFGWAGGHQWTRCKATFTDAELQQLRSWENVWQNRIQTFLDCLKDSMIHNVNGKVRGTNVCKICRIAFECHSADGVVSKGQLLWMLAESGMPVNKAAVISVISDAVLQENSWTKEGIHYR